MIRTIFYATADGRYVEFNRMTGSAVRMVTNDQLPPDVEAVDMTLGAYHAHRFASGEGTVCIGKALGSHFMRALDDLLINPDILT